MKPRLKSGLLPTFPDRRDYAHPSFGAALPPTLPDYYCDAGLTIPDQNQTNIQFNPAVPPLPYGCTSYTTTDLCIDEDLQLYNPMLIENITHSSSKGGGDIRTSLEAARKVLNRGAYFNIRSSGAIDSFDAIRLAMYSTQDEKRAVSMGTPWFPEFEGTTSVKQNDGSYTLSPIQNWNGILPTPQSFSARGLSWHNYAIVGWKTIGDQPYLIVKSWQGMWFADKGFAYMSRSLCNQLMAINGSATFTLGKKPTDVKTIDLSFIRALVSYVRLLIRV